MRTYRINKRVQKLITGFRPVVYARDRLMFGMRQPMEGPVFERLEDAEFWCFHVMVDHFNRRLGLSDARIEPFQGLVDCGATPDPTLLRDVTRICQQVARKRTQRRFPLWLANSFSVMTPHPGQEFWSTVSCCDNRP